MFTLQRLTMIDNDLDAGAEYLEEYAMPEGYANQQHSGLEAQHFVPGAASQYDPLHNINYPASTTAQANLNYQDDYYSVSTPNTSAFPAPWEGVPTVEAPQSSLFSEYPVDLDMFSHTRWNQGQEAQVNYARHGLIPQMGQVLQVGTQSSQLGQLSQGAPEISNVHLGQYRPLDLFGDISNSVAAISNDTNNRQSSSKAAGEQQHRNISAMTLQLVPHLAPHLESYLAPHLTPHLALSLHMTHGHGYSSMPALAQTAQHSGYSSNDGYERYSNDGSKGSDGHDGYAEHKVHPNNDAYNKGYNDGHVLSEVGYTNKGYSTNFTSKARVNTNNAGFSSDYSMRMSPYGVPTTPLPTGTVHRAPHKRRYRVIRGISAGGCVTRPPKQAISLDLVFLPVELKLVGANVEDICFPRWLELEREDKRRIVRIERTQNGAELVANFSIVGAANENPVTLPPQANVDVVEVSCLECRVRPSLGSDDDSSSEDEEKSKSSRTLRAHVKSEPGTGEYFQYYITSVEVVEIVELLIGTELIDPADRRRERGRVRLNLVPFWLKKPILSRMSDHGVPSAGAGNSDFRLDLARRIMGYEIRKPRGFDKEVRILRWDKLVPALKRALQSYYTEIPNN